MNNSGVVYIVHHIDTEGPLREPLPEIFERVENILGIELPISKTKANLKKLQNGQLIGTDPVVISQVKKILDPHLVKLNSTWRELDIMLHKIMSKKFRNDLLDSYKGGWIFNWHVMDHIGFETNERKRDLGYFKIFNHYQKIIQKTKSYKDRIHWHFHPISFFREAHMCATSYDNSYPEIHQILCRRPIDKGWFPKVNRAGFHTERPDSNWFLEQWIPFDPSNQAIEEGRKQIQKDEINGRFGDWNGAPSDWDLYHPDFYDWRKKGNSNRVIARVLNLKSRFREITDFELEKAFLKAENGENVYLGVTNHDWRDMSVEIDDFRKMISRIASKFKNVKYKFSESVDAFRRVLGYSLEDIKNNCVDFNSAMDGNVIKVSLLRGELFGPQPYLAIKTLNGDYFHDNFDFGKFKKEYFYTFDRHTIPVEKIDKIVIASNDKFGNTCLNTIALKKGERFFQKTVF